MTPLKWSIIVFLGGICLLGLPAESQESKPSSAKECRAHIEKALEQYWDQDPQLEENEKSQRKYLKDDQDNEEEDNEDDVSDDDEDFTDEETTSENEKNLESSNIEKEEYDFSEKSNDEEQKIEKEYVDDYKKLPRQFRKEDEHNKISGHTPKNNEDEEQVEDDAIDEDNEEDADIDSLEIVDETSEMLEENSFENKRIAIEEEGKEEWNKEVEEENIELEEEEQQIDKDEEEEEEGQEEEGEQEDEEQENEEEEENEEEQEEEGEQKEEEELEEEEQEKEEENKEVEKKDEEIDKDLSLDELMNEIKNYKVTGEALDGKHSEDEEDEDNDSGSDEKVDDDSIENIYEDDDGDSISGITYRSRDHIDALLGLDEIGTEYDKEEEKLAQSIYKEIKKIYLSHIKPIEMLYKYVDSTTRILGDAEIFNQPMILLLGPWSAGKSSIINYLLGIERTQAALKTGTGITDVDFTLIRYGDQNRVRSGTELAADWRYVGLQKFGQGFLDHFRSIEMPHTLLKKITLVDTPGILESKKNTERGYSLSDAFQWFIDRSDAIYVVLDPTKVDIGGEVGSVIDQLKGRDARFILNKADSIRRSDLMRVVGQLFWNLSPLMSSSEAPVIYALSLTTKPYHPSAPAKFLADQEKNFLYDMKETLEKRVENRILYSRRHAVRVRNHAKMIDCYLATYYKHKSIFSSKRNVANSIVENPRQYNIFEGLGEMKNVSRYDIPDPTAYKEFFKLHPLYDFKALASTCSYFRGCPMEKLDLAISKHIPELLAKYQKIKTTQGR